METSGIKQIHLKKRNGIIEGFQSRTANLCFRFDDGECVIQNSTNKSPECFVPVAEVKEVRIIFA